MADDASQHGAFEGDHAHAHAHDGQTHAHEHTHDGDGVHADHAHEPHMGFGEPDASDVHTDTAMGAPGQKKAAPGQVFMSKLRELVKGKMDPAAYDEAVRQARAHAGGKTSPRKAPTPDGPKPTPAAPDATPSFAEMMASAPGYDWDQVLENGMGPCTGQCCDGCDCEGKIDMACACGCGACDAAGDADDEPWEVGPQLEKTHKAVQYRAADTGGEACALCKFYDADDLSCRLVEGEIQPAMVCGLFDPAMVPATAATEPNAFDLTAKAAGERPDPWRLFIETAAFAEVPEWMPLLPRSGEFKHPQWGKISVTPERNRRFIQNFRDQVYQAHIPIDLEHETKLSGAAGYIRDLRQNGDGSVDARVDWADRGRAMIEQDRFRYVSPEWYDRWEQPDTGKTYRDVLIGAALTTRPYFKDAALRPLVASERGWFIGRPQGGNMAEKQTPNAVPPEAEPTPTQDPPAQATESQAFAEMQGQLRQANERIAAMEDERTRYRFSEMVRGRAGEDDGRPWRGDAEGHVSELLALQKAFGEDSDLFRAHVTREREHAQALRANEAQLRAAGFYSEMGATGDGTTGSAEDRIAAKARELVTKGEAKSMAEATVEVLKREPELYGEHHQSFRERTEGRR